MTTITPNATAVNAYRNLGIRPGTPAGNTGAAAPSGDSFAATLQDAAQSAIQNLKASEIRVLKAPSDHLTEHLGCHPAACG